MLLRLITWPYVRRRLLRSVLTTAGIVLGVAVFTAMHTANQSVLFAFNHTVNRIAGAAQLQITSGETGFDESVLERVQAHPDVRVAVPVIEASVETGLPGQGNLLILAVDLTGDRGLRDYDLDSGDEAVVDDPLVFIAQPDSLIVSRQFLERTGVKLNDRLTLGAMDGPRQFTIRGVMKSEGLASAFGGNLAVMDVYAAQSVFGRGRRFDRIDLAVREGAAVDAVRASLQAQLGGGLEVEPPAARGRQFEATARVFSFVANVSSLFALFIGLFLIYNTFSIAVTERRAEIGILRALGATRGQIQRLFVLESAIAGLAGSVAGLLAGVWLSRGLASYLSGYFGEIYGVVQRAEEVSADPRLLGGALLMGVAASVLAAWIPARAAAAVDPVKALQKGRTQVLGAGENRVRRLAALAIAAAAVIAVLFGRAPQFFYLGYLFSIAAALLLTPTLTAWLARLLRRPLKLLRPVEGALAADSLLGAPRRTSGTVAALCLSLALVITLSGMARSSYQSIREWMDASFNPELFVTTSEQITSRSFRFPPELGAALAGIDGIAEVQAVRTARVVYQGTPVLLVAADIARLAARIRPIVIEGDARDMVQRTGRGEGVMVSENFAQLRRLHVGDVIELPALDAPLRIPIAGVTRDYSDQQGSILLSRELYIRHWNDPSVNVFRIYLRDPARAAAIRQAILDRFGSTTHLFVLTNQELRGFILKITDQWFGITYIQILVAVLVAVLGIVNTLTVSVADRRRELGLLQAVGGLRNQIRGTIWMEAGAIGLMGLTLGYALGALNLYYILEASRRDVSGMTLAYQFPVEIAAALVPVILIAALAAAAGPAETAVRGSLVEALEYE